MLVFGEGKPGSPFSVVEFRMGGGAMKKPATNKAFKSQQFFYSSVHQIKTGKSILKQKTKMQHLSKLTIRHLLYQVFPKQTQHIYFSSNQIVKVR